MLLNDIKDAILSLSEEDFEVLFEWMEELANERWQEEVENDPFARKALEMGYMIMNKPDPVRFIAKLLNCKGEDKKKNEDNNER